MYLEFFGLQTFPFSTTPDTAFFQPLSNWQAIFQGTIQQLNSNVNLICITGEAGAGKTMQCRKIYNALRCHKSRYTPFFFHHTAMSADEFAYTIADEFQIPEIMFKPKGEQVYSLLRSKLSEPGNCRHILLIEEAQHLRKGALNLLIDMLAAESADNQYPIIQVVLFGTSNLKKRLSQLAEENNWISVLELQHLSKEETGSYCRSRLKAANIADPDLFEEKAITALHKFSQGNPRLINLLAHKAMLSAYGKGHRTISNHHVSDAVADSEAMS